MVDLAWAQLGPEGVLRMLLAEHVDDHAHLAPVDGNAELDMGLYRAFRSRGYHVTIKATTEGADVEVER